MKRFCSAGFVAVAFVASLVGCERNSSTSDNTDADVERQTPISAYEVVGRDLSRQLNLSATVLPRVQINLTSRAQGLVAQVLVEEGDQVSAGQLLARFDVLEQQAELRRAEAQALDAELELDRVRQLRESQTTSAADLQRAEAAYAVASSEQELWQARINFGAIYAPTDAVITARYIEIGEPVEPQQHLFTLAKMDELVVRPGVSERDVRYLQQGQQVPVRLDGLPDEEITGEIRRIFPAADQDSRLINIEVLLPADSFERGIRPGFLARLPLRVDPRPNAIAVPAAAVGEDGDAHYVYRVVDDRLQKTPVVLSITRGQWTEIREGIEEGDVVLATNPIDMRDGTYVRIVNWRG